MSSKHLILCRPLLLLPSIFPSIRVFSNESALRIRWPKYWSFSFNISPSSEHPGLISFRMDWLDLLAVHGLSITYSYNISYVQLNKINPFSLETPILQAVPGHCPPLPQAGISHAQGEADTPSLVPQFFPSHAPPAVDLSARTPPTLAPSVACLLRAKTLLEVEICLEDFLEA